MSELYCQGTVQDFDAVVGRGLILTDSGESVQVRYSAIIGQGVRALKVGDRVLLQLERSVRGLNAVQVQRCNP
jgi:cold shock CspA family protein